MSESSVAQVALAQVALAQMALAQVALAQVVLAQVVLARLSLGGKLGGKAGQALPAHVLPLPCTLPSPHTLAHRCAGD